MSFKLFELDKTSESWYPVWLLTYGYGYVYVPPPVPPGPTPEPVYNFGDLLILFREEVAPELEHYSAPIYDDPTIDDVESGSRYYSGHYFATRYFGGLFGKSGAGHESSGGGDITNTMDWDTYKRLFYHWKLNRDIGGSNENYYAYNRTELYFHQPDVDLLDPVVLAD